MNPPHEIWTELLGTIKKTAVTDIDPTEARSTAKRLQQWLKALEILQQTHPNLYVGENVVKLTTGEPEKLRDKLVAGAALRHAVIRIRFINRGFRRGQKAHKWEIELLPEPMFLPRDPPLFTPKTFRQLEQCRILTAAFQAHLVHGVDSMIPSQAIGQLLLSAILSGGLLSRRWLAPWVKALGCGIRITEGVSWLDMVLPVHVDNNRAFGLTRTDPIEYVSRRWFPDQVTEALMFRTLNQTPQFLTEVGKIVVPPEVSAAQSSAKNKEKANIANAGQPEPTKTTKTKKLGECTWRFLYSFLLTLPLPKGHLPRDLSELLSWATARHAFFLPPYLLHYATGKHDAVSLPPEVWTRVRTGGKIIRERPHDPTPDDHKTEHGTVPKN